MRERDGKKFSLDLPEGMTCKDCEKFLACIQRGCAEGEDQQCDWIPSNFSFKGEESKAEKMVREHKEKYVEEPSCQQP
jgi:hypothetical protein